MVPPASSSGASERRPPTGIQKTIWLPGVVHPITQEFVFPMIVVTSDLEFFSTMTEWHPPLPFQIVVLVSYIPCLCPSDRAGWTGLLFAKSLFSIRLFCNFPLNSCLIFYALVRTPPVYNCMSWYRGHRSRFFFKLSRVFSVLTFRRQIFFSNR